MGAYRLVSDIIANILSTITCFCHTHCCYYCTFPIFSSLCMGLDHLATLILISSLPVSGGRGGRWPASSGPRRSVGRPSGVAQVPDDPGDVRLGAEDEVAERRVARDQDDADPAAGRNSQLPGRGAAACSDPKFAVADQRPELTNNGITQRNILKHQRILEAIKL